MKLDWREVRRALIDNGFDALIDGGLELLWELITNAI